MKKTLNVVRYALVSLFSFLFIGSALAVEPVAIWEGANLVDGATYTKEGGVTYTLHANGNTVGADGITISTGKGVSVTPASGDIGNQATTVIIRYTNYDTSSLGTDDAQVLIMNHVNNADDRDFIGMAATGEGKLWGIWQNTKWGSNKTGAGYGSAASDTKTFAFTWAQSGTAGAYCWMNGASKAGWGSLHGGRQIDSVWVGGPNESTTLTSATNMKILGIAVFDSRLADNDIASFRWPSQAALYTPFMDNFSDRIMTITSAGNANAGVDISGGSGTFALFDPATGANTTTTFTGNQNTSSLPGYTSSTAAWRGFCDTQNGYVAPGLVMRFSPYVAGRSITVGGTFSPFNLGGLVVEEGASSGSTIPSLTQGGDRTNKLGDARENGGVPTFFVLRDSFKINRKGFVNIYGDITFDIANGKYFDCNTANSAQPVALQPGAIFRMVGEGTFKVSALTATGAVTLDCSKQGSRVNTTAFIEGNLTTDGMTKFVFPSTLAEDTASVPLCSGTLTAVGGVHEITVGGEKFFAKLTFDTTAKTVKYVKVTDNKGTVASGTTTWSAIAASITDFNAELPTELTLKGDVEIDFNGETIPLLTLKGAHTATLVYTVSPTFTNGLKVEDGAAYAVKIPATSDFSTTTELVVPAGVTYTIYGPTAEAKTWTGKVTVNGTLKTEGKLDFSNGGNGVAVGGTLEIVSGLARMQFADRGMKGTLNIDADATLQPYGTVDSVNYDGVTEVNVYGTLDMSDASRGRWTLRKTNVMNFYAGSTCKGDGQSSGNNIGALQFNNSNDCVLNFLKSGVEGGTVEFSAKLHAQSAFTMNVAEGVTVNMSGSLGTGKNPFTFAGAGTINLTGTYEFNNPVTIGEDATLVLAGGSFANGFKGTGTVKTASGITADLSAMALPTTLKFAPGTFKVGVPSTATIGQLIAPVTTGAQASDYTIYGSDDVQLTSICVFNGALYYGEVGSDTYTFTPDQQASITAMAAGEVYGATTMNVAITNFEGVPEGYFPWIEGGHIYVAKKSNSINIKFTPASDKEGMIATTDVKVGGYPVAGKFWNHSMICTTTGVNTGITEVFYLKDGNGADAVDPDGNKTVCYYYAPNMYDVNKRNVGGRNAQTTGNGKLTYSYFDDPNQEKEFPLEIGTLDNVTYSLPGSPSGKLGWEVAIENVPYQIFDLYIYQASDQTADTINLMPIAVKANDGDWKYFGGDGQGSTIPCDATLTWHGAPYCDSETMVEGTNYIRYRMSKAALGLGDTEKIEKIYLSHPDRPTNSSRRLGLAGVQIVQVLNDGYFFRDATCQSADWVADGAWKNGAGEVSPWANRDDANKNDAYATIDADAINTININGTIVANEVILKNAAPADGDPEKVFTFTASENCTLTSPIDATGFHGKIVLCEGMTGAISLGEHAYIEVEVPANTTKNVDDLLPTGITISGGNVKVIGAGTLVCDGALPTAYQPSFQAGTWTGTLYLKNIAWNSFGFGAYGHAGSKIKVTGITGFGPNSTGDGVNPELILEDSGDTKAILINDGFGGKDYFFSKVSGSGTFAWDADSTKSPGGPIYIFRDVSDFDGVLDAGPHLKIVVGNTTAGTDKGSITFANGITVKAGLGWTAQKAYFGETLTVKGALGDTLVEGLTVAPASFPAVTLVDAQGQTVEGDYTLAYAEGKLVVSYADVSFTVPAITGATASIDVGTLVEGTATVPYGANATITYTADSGKLFSDGFATKTVPLTNIIDADAATLAINTAIDGVTTADAEAQIGSTLYLTLADAFAVDGQKYIMLLKNVELTDWIVVDSVAALELNGFTISQSASWAPAETSHDHLFCVTYGGTFSVLDAYSEGGTIDATGNGDLYGAIKMTNKGDVRVSDEIASLTVFSGTIIGNYAAISGNGGRPGTEITIGDDYGSTLIKAVVENDSVGIFNPQDGTVTITGGTIEGAMGIIMKSGSLLMTDGKVVANGEYAEWVKSNNGFNNTGDAIEIDNIGYPGAIATVSISENAIVESAYGAAVASHADGDYTPITGFIAGGKFKGAIDTDTSLIATSETGIGKWTTDADGYMVPAEDPAMARIGSTLYRTLAEAVTAATDNDEVELLADMTIGGISIPSGKNITLEFNGKTITFQCPGAGSAGTKTIGFQILEGSTIVFQNGTIQCSEANKDATWQSDSAQKGIAMMIQNYANLTLDKMTIDGANIAHNGVATRYVMSNNSGTVSIYDTTITAAEGDFAFDACKYRNYALPTITVDGSTYYGSVIEGNVELSGGNLNLVKGSIDGELVDGGIGDGVIIKGAAFDVVAPDGYVWNDEGYLIKASAKIGSIFYLTLADAVAAAVDDNTVELLASCTGDGIKINKSITIDFGGFVYTVDASLVGSPSTQSQAFNLVRGNTITLKNGTIASKVARMLVQNYASLTLEDMILDGSELAAKNGKGNDYVAYTLSNCAGDTVITGDTVISARALEGQTSFAFDTYYQAGKYEDATVTVDGDVTIMGDIELAGGSLTLTAGTLNGALVAGANIEKGTVTKADAFEAAAPAGYEWKDGVLVKAGGKIVPEEQGTVEVTGDGEDAVAVITPKQGVTKVDITMPSGFEGKYEIPSSITQITGVEIGQLIIKSSGFDIAPACKIDNDDIVLDATKSVVVGDETIPVAPTLTSSDDDVKPLVIGDTTAVGVKAIPGLTYSLVRSTVLGGDETNVKSVTATATRVTLEDEFEGGKPPSAFYVIKVTK